MTTNLQNRIAAIKAECEEILRLSEKLDPWKWKTRTCYIGDGFEVYPLVNNKRKPDLGSWTELAHCKSQDGKNRHNASFIAHSRNVSPAMARVVLLTTHDAEMKEDEHLLQLIANQWEGKQ